VEIQSTKDKRLIDLCCKEISSKLGWGDPEQWFGQEFDRLSEKIFESTSVKISETTLKRVFGRVKYDNAPSLTTLDTLSSFLGYDDWRSFVAGHQNGIPKSEQIQTERIDYSGYRRIFGRAGVLVVSLILITVFVGWYLSGRNLKADAAYSRISFNSEPVSKGLPNTVIFNVDGNGINTAGMFVQQSWDKRLRTEIKEGQKEIATTYYYPGYFRAKLVKNDEVLQEHDIYITTEGWLMTVGTDPVPLYVTANELGASGPLQIPERYVEQIDKINSDKPVKLGFHFYKEFKNIDGSNFTFETKIRNTSNNGNLVCKKSQVLVHCTEGVISFPLSIPGCVGELNVMVIDNYLSGSENDFSSFGVDFESPVDFKIVSSENKVRAFINDQLIREIPIAHNPGKVVGVRIEFDGTGEVLSAKLNDLVLRE